MRSYTAAAIWVTSTAVSIAAVSLLRAEERRPNILFILADDLDVSVAKNR